MIFNIYSIYDSKAAAFLPPFTIQNEAMALRVFLTTLRDKNHQFGQNPGDYSLFLLGEFNDNIGMINDNQTTTIINGLTLLSDDKFINKES